jgi:hypothetical protein
VSEAMAVRINDKPLRCQHCGGGKFHHRTATLDRMAAGGLLHLQGLFGHYAAMYVCAACGCTHWFSEVPGVRHEQDENLCTEARPRQGKSASKDACLACGQSIPDQAERCPACGWSWDDDQSSPS